MNEKSSSFTAVGAAAAAAASGRGARPHRRPAGQSRHAGRDRLLVDAPLPEGIPVRPPGDRGEPPQVVVDPQSHRPDGPAAAQRGATTTRSGTGNATNRRSRPSPVRKPRSWRRRSRRSHPSIIVDWAMRYGNPSIPSRLASLQAQGCERILLVPLYPQYCRRHHRDGVRQGLSMRSSACAGSRRCGWRRLTTTTRSTSRRWHRRSRRSSPKLPFSPRSSSPRSTACRRTISHKGDPYHCHCVKTRGCCASGSGLDEEQLDADVPVALRHAPNGCSPTPTRPSRRWPSAASSSSPSSRPASRPTAWRRWKRSPARTPRSSGMPAARTLPRSRVSTTASKECT